MRTKVCILALFLQGLGALYDDSGHFEDYDYSHIVEQVLKCIGVKMIFSLLDGQKSRRGRG